jgi:diguanylate cyclase (GGDEF)-like protein
VVAYVDVIGLKTLNDSAGHSAGDKLLQHVVALIKKHLRSYDLIIRMGGDESYARSPTSP